MSEVNKGGRPSSYTDDLGKLICERVATNPVGIETLCKLYPDLPSQFTIKAWRKTYPQFSAWYLDAKAFQAQINVEDIDDLIPSELRYYVDDKGNERIDAPSASLLIAKINNRKWMAARLAPKIYGDKAVEAAVATNTVEVQERVNKINKESEKEF